MPCWIASVSGSVKSDFSMQKALSETDRFKILTAVRQSLELLRTLGIDTLESAPDTLEQIQADVQACNRCCLREQTPQPVCGEGTSQARLVFITGFPVAPDLEIGRPLQGPAGELFTKMIGAMGLDRAAVYVIPLLKCGPGDTRAAAETAAACCRSFLDRQLSVIAPECICIFGEFAASLLLNTREPLAHIRGKFHTYNTITALATWDPDTLLRNPALKRDAWQDLQAIMACLGLNRPT